MAVPAELLGQLGELDDPAERVRQAVNKLLDAAREPESPLTVNEGIQELERAVDGWLEVTEQIEQRLREHAAEFDEDRLEAAPWFADAVGENTWRGGRALVPADWHTSD
jgi:hypothetical protein